MARTDQDLALLPDGSSNTTAWYPSSRPETDSESYKSNWHSFLQYCFFISDSYISRLIQETFECRNTHLCMTPM